MGETEGPCSMHSTNVPVNLESAGGQMLSLLNFSPYQMKRKGRWLFKCWVLVALRLGANEGNSSSVALCLASHVSVLCTWVCFRDAHSAFLLFGSANGKSAATAMGLGQKAKNYFSEVKSFQHLLLFTMANGETKPVQNCYNCIHLLNWSINKYNDLHATPDL